jgi:hypothetical protein
MNTSIEQVAEFGLGEFGMTGDFYFAAPIELDYDEPNAVVEQDAIEFVSPAPVAVTAVELPVVSVLGEPANAQPATQTAPAQRRTAA